MLGQLRVGKKNFFIISVSQTRLYFYLVYILRQMSKNKFVLTNLLT